MLDSTNWKIAREPTHPKQSNSIPFTVEDIYQQLRRCKTGKVPGPDRITGRLLKNCALELSPVLHLLFKQILQTAIVHMLWKTATIIHIPKSPCPSDLNQYRTVGVTSILAKCLEKLALNVILPFVCPRLDPYQFAYKAKRGTEDAVTYLLHTLLQHLEVPGNQARILFVDINFTFNTIQHHIMITKLHPHMPPLFICWIYNFLSDRPQSVRMGIITSTTITVNTRAPQRLYP